MAEESEKKEEIRFKDRRRFAEQAPEPDKEEPVSPQEEAAEQRPSPDRTSGPLPEITFANFMMSLSTQALLFLGEIPDPQNGKAHQDLPAAQQIIDILGLLQEKTKGNLDKQEEQLLEHLLYDLRMKYVALAGRT
jgi:hypothetical protein